MNHSNATLIKRLLCIIYDLFLLIAAFFIIGIIVSSISTFIINDGNAITDDHPFYIYNQAIILTSLLFTALLFFGWFWRHGGQTLGMKTWRVQLVSDDQMFISWDQVFIRFFVAMLSWACFGLGFIWCLIDLKGRSWHDIASHTQLKQLEKKTS